MKDKPVAVVTGAGSGIGRAVCELLASVEHRITLVGRDESRLQQTMQHIGEHSAATPEMLLAPADIADAEQARSVIDMTGQQWGRVDVLVNNAGVAPRLDIDQTDEDLLYRVFSINAFGPAHLIARAWPLFRRQHGGCVVNVSSMSACDPLSGFLAYGASKAALESFTRSIIVEGRALGIRAFNVAPGAVETPMMRRLFSTRDVPESRALKPLDVAHVICDCILGRRDKDLGGTILLPSP